MTLDAMNALKFLPELSDADVFTCLSLGCEKGENGTRQAPFQNVGNSYVSTVLPELTYITRAMRAQKKDWVHLDSGYMEHEGRKLFFVKLIQER